MTQIESSKGAPNDGDCDRVGVYAPQDELCPHEVYPFSPYAAPHSPHVSELNSIFLTHLAPYVTPPFDPIHLTGICFGAISSGSAATDRSKGFAIEVLGPPGEWDWERALRLSEGSILNQLEDGGCTPVKEIHYEDVLWEQIFNAYAANAYTRSATALAYDSTMLATMHGHQRVHVLKDLAHAIDRRRHPNAVIGPPYLEPCEPTKYRQVSAHSSQHKSRQHKSRQHKSRQHKSRQHKPRHTSTCPHMSHPMYPLFLLSTSTYIHI